MNIAFCVGNGPSIVNVDLASLKNIGPVYGCNHLIEKFALDNTIAVDHKVLVDLIANGHNQRSNIYTRSRWQKLIEGDNVHFLSNPIADPQTKWDREIHWGSGTHAINLAASHNPDIVVMIGYDLYNTNFDPGCWIYQINKCFELYPHIQFVQIQPAGWEVPVQWNADNFSVDNFESLAIMLKDLQ